jgi:hypothetical protein
VFDQLSYVSCTQEASLASTTIDSEMTEAGCAGTATAQGTADASTQHEEAKHIKQEEVEVSSACVAVDVSTSSHAMEPALAATTATAGFSSHKVQQRVQQLLDQQQVVEEQTMSQQGEDDAASDAVKDQAGLHEIASTTSSVRTVTCSVELSEGSGDSETAGQKAAAVQPDDPKQQQQQEQHHQVSELVIYAGHKGFVRLAIEQQASLVPVLALGEVLQVRVAGLGAWHWFTLLCLCGLPESSCMDMVASEFFIVVTSHSWLFYMPSGEHAPINTCTESRCGSRHLCSCAMLSIGRPFSAGATSVLVSRSPSSLVSKELWNRSLLHTASARQLHAGFHSKTTLACHIYPPCSLGMIISNTTYIRPTVLAEAELPMLTCPLVVITCSTAGRWSLPFLPIRTPLIYVVGDPIPPPPLPADGEWRMHECSHHCCLTSVPQVSKIFSTFPHSYVPCCTP